MNDATRLLNEKYQGIQNQAYLDDCDRLKNGEPLAYVIGYIPFLDCNIYLDSKPLIPRPETEYWTEKVIATIKERANNNGVIKVLDLCAGSGAVGVALLKAINNIKVDFIEIEPSHLKTIERNIRENLTSHDKVERNDSNIYIGDLFKPLKQNQKYDFILSNPPYIPTVNNQTDNSVLENEPHEALFGGVDGLDLISKIITEAKLYLKENGQLWLEHESTQVQIKAINQLAFKYGFTPLNHKDQYGVYRYSQLLT